MEVRQDHVVINPAAEIQAVTAYLAPRWCVPEKDLAPVVARIHQRAAELAAAWFDVWPLYDVLDEAEDKRTKALQDSLVGREKQVGPDFDCVVRQLSSLRYRLDAFREAGLGINAEGRWDFGKAADRLAADLHRALPWTAKLKPSHWEDLIERRQRGSGERARELAKEEAAFAGHDLSGAGSLSLVETLSPASVLYSHENQGLPPERSFVGAVLSHCLRLTEHNNTVAMVRDLQRTPVDSLPAEVLFDKRLSFRPGCHPILKALDASCQELDRLSGKTQTREDYERALARPYKLRSPKEIKALSDAIIDKILAEEEDGELDRREEKEKSVFRKHLGESLLAGVVEAEGPG